VFGHTFFFSEVREKENKKNGGNCQGFLAVFGNGGETA
jgi:hypothetical protein